MILGAWELNCCPTWLFQASHLSCTEWLSCSALHFCTLIFIFLFPICVLCCSSQSPSHSINEGRISLWKHLAPPCEFPERLCACLRHRTVLDKEGHGVCPRQHWTCCSCSPNDNDSLLHALTATSLCLEQNSQHKEVGQCLWLMEWSTEPSGCQPAVARARGFYNASLWLGLYLLGVWLKMLERSLLWSTVQCLNIQMVSNPEACWIMAARSEIRCLLWQCNIKCLMYFELRNQQKYAVIVKTDVPSEVCTRR